MKNTFIRDKHILHDNDNGCIRYSISWQTSKSVHSIYHLNNLICGPKKKKKNCGSRKKKYNWSSIVQKHVSSNTDAANFLDTIMLQICHVLGKTNSVEIQN